MSYEAIAGRYAHALFDIGIETGTLGKLADEISAFADTWTASDELRAVLDNPLMSETDREALLDAIAKRLGSGEITKNTLRLLARRRRLPVLPSIARALRSMSDDKEGVVRATVVARRARIEKGRPPGRPYVISIGGYEISPSCRSRTLQASLLELARRQQHPRPS